MFLEFPAHLQASAAWDREPAECRVASPEQVAPFEAVRTDPVYADAHARNLAYEDELFVEFVIPDGPWRSPPHDARVLFRTIAPPGGLYGNTIWTAVWQESDGSWWFWKQDREPRVFHQPPAPGSAPSAASDTEPWKPVSGRLRAPTRRRSKRASTILAAPRRVLSGPAKSPTCRRRPLRACP